MRRPNVLILYTDQQRWDALGAAGNDDVDTPALDRLAGDGVSFERCFVQAPICMPSRASFLTGQYPSQLDIYGNGIRLPEGTRTLPRLLANYGYTSANVGKLHFTTHADREDRAVHPDYGFDQLELSDARGNYADAYRAWVRAKAPDQLPDVNRGLSGAGATWKAVVDGPDRFPDGTPRDEYHPPREAYDPPRPIPFGADADLTHSAFVAEQTREFLREHRDERFLCVAGFHEPHSPFIVPQRFLDRYDPATFELPSFPDGVDHPDEEELRAVRHGYYAMVSQVDHHVGRILDTLSALELERETVVVFTSDHGEFLGEHGRYGKGWPAPDPVSRVPCLVRWPGGIADPGRTEHDVIEAVDLVPTVLDCAGIQVPPHLQGRSFEPLLRDPEAGPDAPGRGYEPRDGALVESDRGKVLRTADEYRYVFDADGAEALYDLDAEHGEYHDVAGEAGYAYALDRCRTGLLERVVAGDVAAERPNDWAY